METQYRIDQDSDNAAGGHTTVNDDDNVTMTLAKKTVYVGGLGDSISREMVENAFVPFGDIIQISIPLDPSQKSRGFAFVEYEDAEDAKAAIDNMDRCELNGKVVTVNLARPVGQNVHGTSNISVWKAQEMAEEKQRAQDVLEREVEDAEGTHSDALQPSNKRVRTV